MTGRTIRITGIAFRMTASMPAQQPVGDVDVGGEVFGTSVALEDWDGRDRWDRGKNRKGDNFSEGIFSANKK